MDDSLLDDNFTLLYRGLNNSTRPRQLQEGRKIKDQKELKSVCQEFEAVFLEKLWQEMKKTVPKSGLWDNRIEEHYLSLFDQEFARKMAQGGGIGLADQLYQQLSRQLENASTPPPGLEREKGLADKEDRSGRSSMDRHSGTAKRQAIGPGQGEFLEAIRQDPCLVKLKVELLAREIESGSEHSPEYSSFQQSVQVGGGQRDVEVKGSGLAQSEALLHLKQEKQTTSSQPLPLLQEPVSGKVSSGFGWRKNPLTGRSEFHPGVDYAVPEGTTVQACWPGRVLFAGQRGGYGKLVILTHGGGWRSYYGHLSSIAVQEGQEVGAGLALGKSGNSGLSTGPHLHFEIRQGDVAWDPGQLRNRMLAGLPIGRQA